ncbi:deoxyribose-phosphate aldolase [Pseudoalteromonas sp. HL-AS2]|uniref:deoxyribose-phosphate aldolase n=1 Tax=Pseudoalteromonas TaxID=53246 RepID=UPI00097F02DF|nr:MULTISPECIES: deoxyribose-phosphate aldolase [Pseudoalteromonas]MBB1370433.1 deoxyribose-phosphate aldolase [Pseudoalteromonas sp. SR45-4]MBE0420965.1 deoxyribose-phosphate aldolase [Pseudoalteromonas nigrifaciens]MBH0093755.1 deoxyribose-phosphate aldolase [Pseudoalteromonas sp. SCQQ13]NYR13708.1 deoxyribose-phosphate aldolase [Pseudoalteromonas sp. MIP2626]PCC13934.1 deoxyribose-phosphate aldolase [Pseudoalteromonas sp. JB197]
MIKQQKEAALAVALMDLTSLNSNDDSAAINTLVNSINPKLGTPAAVCVYSDFVAEAKIALATRELSHIKVATVTNFPTGDAPLNTVINETLIAIERGADEIDLVIPYKALIAGDKSRVLKYVTESKKVCGSRALLKVIIESGELQTPDLIASATLLAIKGGADFVKTSTGKVAVNATLDATKTILNTIKESGKLVGFKAAGGVKTVADASDYLTLASTIMGNDYLQANTFRFGASSLLTNVYAVLNEA